MGRSQFYSHKRVHYGVIVFLLMGAVFLLPGKMLANPLSPLGIAGWPTPDFNEQEPSTWLGGDPVLGRLICPSLTRLNLQKKESEALVLKSVQVEHHPKNGFTWVLGLRTGIFWWSGKELDSTDLAEFLKKNLERIVLKKGSGQWTLPAFEVQAEKESLRVVWKKEPEFGPYILNDAILWKERNTQDAIKFECVGRFIPSKTPNAIVLTSNTRYLNEPQSYSFESLELFRDKKRRGFEFVMPEDQSFASEKRKALEKAPCECLIDLPLVSAILWHESPKLNQTVRKRLSTLIPREALSKIAAGYWASDPSSLIPKNHPGYDGGLEPPSFSLSRASQRVPLFLSTVRGKVGLVEKVISDNLLVGGFDVEFLDTKDSRVDGLITGIFFPWPDLDLYDSFHSKGKHLVGPKRAVPLELDKALDRYRRSLTQQSPDFDALKKIHKHLHELEYVSVLMQHQACLEFKGLAKKKIRIDVKDPDWFLDLMTMSGGVS